MNGQYALFAFTARVGTPSVRFVFRMIGQFCRFGCPRDYFNADIIKRSETYVQESRRVA